MCEGEGAESAKGRGDGDAGMKVAGRPGKPATGNFVKLQDSQVLLLKGFILK